MCTQVRADARITIAPLVDTLPCLGAVSISLLDPPHLDVSLQIFGGLDLMLLPGLREAVHFAIHKVLETCRPFFSSVFHPCRLRRSGSGLCHCCTHCWAGVCDCILRQCSLFFCDGACPVSRKRACLWDLSLIAAGPEDAIACLGSMRVLPKKSMTRLLLPRVNRREVARILMERPEIQESVCKSNLVDVAQVAAQRYFKNVCVCRCWAT